MTTSSLFRQPMFLTEADEPRYRVRCPVLGFIQFSENERAIIDHWIFRRLRQIRQLALTDMVYPGATHTRFEHSLGVMELATRAFDQIAAKRGGLLEKKLQEVPAFNKQPLAIARQVLRVAALLHDVGHSCFSHGPESVIHQGLGHEVLTYQLIDEEEFLGRVLAQAYFQGFASLVVQVLRDDAGMPPQLKVVKDLVSGEMDADRSDYLLRDSHHCGVEYGRFDHRRLVQCLDLHEADGGVLEIGLQRDGIHAFEALILARYQMNTQVYYHRIRRIYDHYLCRYFEAKGKELYDTPEKILKLTDVAAMAMILEDADAGTTDGSQWARRIRDREHHRVVHETGEDANYMDLKHSEQLIKIMKQRYPHADLVFDVAKSSIHKLLLPNDTDRGEYVALAVSDHGGETSYLGRRSHILRWVPRSFQIARIFADAGGDKELFRSMRSFARNEYLKLGGLS